MRNGLISLDVESTGVDFQFGTKPFFVTTCNEEGEQRYWEWPVNPLTRQPVIPPGDIQEIREYVAGKNVVFHNAKFDVKALASIGIRDWDWSRTHDTLIAGHLLASNQPHNLTDMALHYLGVDIYPFETRLEKVVQACRRYCRTHHKDWRIAKEGMADMPSAGEKTWKADMWLPTALAATGEGEQEYASVLAEYSNTDSAVTVALWKTLERELKSKGLWDIYLTRLKVLPVAYHMESRGITVNKSELDRMTVEYGNESIERGKVCTGIAAGMGYDLSLPENGVNGSLRTFMFDVLGLEGIRNPKAKTDAPTLNKTAMEYYLGTLDKRSKQYLFVKSLLEKRSRDTAVAYMSSYEKFWVPVDGCPGWYRLHPDLNPTGTDTLRWSCRQPNEQNISKKENFNLRRCFGPAPGREWWSLDAKNIELRLPAYECREEAMIALFERPDEAPYYGSNHLLVAHILFPKLFEECRDAAGNLDGRIFKKRYEATYYKWVKNGNFAVIYGAGDETADRAYHLPGAKKIIDSRLRKMADLNKKWVAFAEKHGYVETMPDKSVDPDRGYPIMCTRTEYGKVLSTVPLNYHIQGTAMWWMGRAMARSYDQLREWRDGTGFDGYLIMQVHDELVFDFPKSAVHPKDDTGRFRRSNLWRVRKIQSLMEQGGKDIGVPTPTSCEYHEHNWSEGVTL